MIRDHRWDVGPGRHSTEGGCLTKNKGLGSGSYLHWVYLSLLSIWLTEVLREEEDNFQMKLPSVLFGFNVVAGWFWNTTVCLSFSTSYVQFTHTFLFGLHLPLLTQSSLFLFSLCQTTVLPPPLASLTCCLPCTAFCTEACLCSLFLYKE